MRPELDYAVYGGCVTKSVRAWRIWEGGIGRLRKHLDARVTISHPPRDLGAQVLDVLSVKIGLLISLRIPRPHRKFLRQYRIPNRAQWEKGQ